MELVLVERRFEQAMKFTDIQNLENEGASCLETHRVRFLKTFFSKDRRRMLCLYEAPDAESVRLAEDQARVPYERAWSCQIIGGQVSADDFSGEYVVAERSFPSPITAEFVATTFCGAQWCLDLHKASYIESFLGKDGLRMVCVFRAPDAESVRMANTQGGVPFTEIWTASLHVS